MSEAYDKYLEEHISNVLKAFKILWEALTPEWFESKGLSLTLMNYVLTEHDKSKYSKDEYDAYDEYFYPSEDNSKSKEEIQRDFDYAWLNHIHNNPHHWQYWVLREDDGDTKVLDMALQEVINMICDWMSFSIKRNSPFEWINFYNENIEKDKILLGENTKKLVEDVIEKYTIYIQENPQIFETI